MARSGRSHCATGRSCRRGRSRSRGFSSASTSSLKTRKSWCGLIDPLSRSSSPYLLSLKWKPPSFPKRCSRATICSMLTFGRMVAKVDRGTAPWAQLLGGEDRAPQSEITDRIEGRLVHLVLEQHPPVVGKARRRSGRRCPDSGRAMRPRSCWPGKLVPSPTHTVRAVDAQLPADLDALDIVFDRLGARRRDRRGRAIRSHSFAAGPAGPGRCWS